MPNDDLTRTVDLVIGIYRRASEIEETLQTAIESDNNAVIEGNLRTAKQELKELKAWIADYSFNKL